MIKELLVTAQITIMIQYYLKNGTFEDILDYDNIECIKFESIEHTLFKNKVVKQKNIKEFIEFLAKNKCKIVALGIDNNCDRDLCGVINGMPCYIYVELKDIAYIYHKVIEINNESKLTYNYKCKQCKINNDWGTYNIKLLENELVNSMEFFKKINCKNEANRMLKSIEMLEHPEEVNNKYVRMLPKNYYETTIAQFAATINAYYYGELFNPNDKVIDNALTFDLAEDYYKNSEALFRMLNKTLVYLVNITRRC